MKASEKIGITVLVILIIIWIIIFLSSSMVKPVARTNCKTACIGMGGSKWFFSGGGHINKNIYATKEQCVFACQAKVGKRTSR